MTALASHAPRDKVAFIHILRGLAPLLVLWAHVPGLWLLTHQQTWDVFQVYKLAVLQPLQISDGGGHLGVVVFFLISGYIISMVAPDETPSEFIVKRVLRLAPALFVSTLVAFALSRWSIGAGMGALPGTDAVSARDFVNSALLVNWFLPGPRALSVVWSLVPEVMFYAMALLLICTLRLSASKATLGLMLLSGLLVAPMHLSGYFGYLGYFTVYLPLFVIGRAFFLEARGQLRAQQAVLIVLVNVLLLVAVYQSRFPGELFQADSGRIWNFAFGIMIFRGLMALDIQSCPRIIAFFADISYALYLVHLPVGMAVLNWAADWPVAFGLKAVMAILATIGTAYVIHLVVERPAGRLARVLVRPLRRGRPVPVRPMPQA